MGAALDPLRRQLGEPALDEVQPGAVGRREMEREARVADEPALRSTASYGSRSYRAPRARRGRPAPRRRSGSGSGETPRHGAGASSPRSPGPRRHPGRRTGWSCRCGCSRVSGAPALPASAAAPATSGRAPGSATSHRHTNTTAASGGSEIEPDDVSHLVDELRIRRELERLDLMRLEREGPPDAADRALAHPGRRRHRPCRPVRRIGRQLLERLDDHPLDVVVADRARLSRPRLVMQAVEAAPREPAPPLANRRTRTAQLGPDLRARAPLRRRQHDPAAKCERLRTLRTPSPALEYLHALHRSARPRHDAPASLPQSSLTRTTFEAQPRVPPN